MAKSLHFTRLMSSSARMALSSHFPFSIKPRIIHKPYFFSSTPYPLQYDMIINRPTQSSLSQPRRRPPRAIESTSPDPAEPDFDSWVDNKLASEREKGRPGSGDPEMDKEKRKYYSKRRKRLYGSDSEDEGRRKSDEGFVELKPEVVEFDRLHQREEELYFYDTFAYPWEKDKHYKMVYQLEKKYFPDQGLDKAFLQPGESPKGDGSVKVSGKKSVAYGGKKRIDESDDGDEKLLFFDEVKVKEKEKVVEESVTEKKVEQFFKGLTKSGNERGVASGGGGGGDGEPFLVTRNGELPPRWDGPNGTVLLVNKPKGWTSFTVCGKLRRIVKVKKVGHAGTLDPMATGLLMVCVGKATKVVDRYQGMIKGYSGVFRLGEATSTLDADSPVIQREPWDHIKDDDIKKALTSFLGEIWQVPPMFSAIKVGGEKMYDKARRGETVTEALAGAGLESSNLIVGIDFTKSNEWTGARSFNRKSLHFIGNSPNPYEQAITIIGRTLAAFDEDNLIPCYGFGDASTHDQDVFSFNPDDRFCNGFEEVLGRYKEIVPQLKLAGPTSFAPIIDMAMTIVEQSGGQYHVLVIIADGQVTRSVDTENGQLSPQEQKTVDAIVQASKLPLSIVLVGVGDGPWDMMREFDDNIPSRAFDNFQFVNFTEIMSKNKAQSFKETEFALSALMEIPQQYKATLELNLLGRRNGYIPERFPLPPPMHGGYNKPKATPRVSSFNPSVPPYPTESYPVRSSPAPPATTTSASDNQLCPICLSNPKDMAFGCGHQTCCECGPDLQMCPICRAPIHTRIKLY
ncbi:unnamed protein product [Brassica napus]|uniref:(rape) hypothetical protein n=1 Tax=Brassica napus TaxID=3708 RepID=A0A817BQ24_BRANA|nr:unnamed protein product [Brassica napus]